MAKSMAASLTAAVRRGYDAARRCDGYGSHAYCVPATTRRWPWRRCTTARCATAFLTGGARPLRTSSSTRTGRWLSTPLLGEARTDWHIRFDPPWTVSELAELPVGTQRRTRTEFPSRPSERSHGGGQICFPVTGMPLQSTEQGSPQLGGRTFTTHRQDIVGLGQSLRHRTRHDGDPLDHGWEES